MIRLTTVMAIATIIGIPRCDARVEESRLIRFLICGDLSNQLYMMK
jgi:hypothetical protein